MSIADRIAAEHRWTGEETRDGKRCSCDTYTKQHVLHVAEVTERAVRAQVAADIRAAGKAKGDPESDLQLGVRLGVDEAARIAEEGPRP